MFVYLCFCSALLKLADLVLSLTTGDGWIAKLGWKVLLQYESGGKKKLAIILPILGGGAGGVTFCQKACLP